MDWFTIDRCISIVGKCTTTQEAIKELNELSKQARDRQHTAVMKVKRKSAFANPETAHDEYQDHLATNYSI